jgi:hypothetical protein
VSELAFGEYVTEDDQAFMYWFQAIQKKCLYTCKYLSMDGRCRIPHSVLCNAKVIITVISSSSESVEPSARLNYKPKVTGICG